MCRDSESSGIYYQEVKGQKRNTMKAIMLVENQSVGECKAAHGLSLYIETPVTGCSLIWDRTILFLRMRKKWILIWKSRYSDHFHGHYDHEALWKNFCT